jgi:four helix bundle protein
MAHNTSFGGYKNLKVWAEAIVLVTEIYAITKKYPEDEKFGLVSQMRRSAVSIPSNIAEGQCRASKKDFINFLRIAYASGAELETQLIISQKLEYLDTLEYERMHALLEEVLRMLVGLMKSLRI